MGINLSNHILIHLIKDIPKYKFLSIKIPHEPGHKIKHKSNLLYNPCL